MGQRPRIDFRRPFDHHSGHPRDCSALSGLAGALPQADYEIAPLALNRRTPEAHEPNQSPPLMPAKPKNAKQTTCDRCGLRNYCATNLDVIDLGLGIGAIGRSSSEYHSQNE